MLKILVCVKQIPDIDLVRMDPETGNLIRTGVPTLTNPLDLNALEAAVQVKERYGGEITLITMGPPMAESTLREGLAVGGDRAVLITGRPFGGADTLSTSYAIVKAAEMESWQSVSTRPRSPAAAASTASRTERSVRPAPLRRAERSSKQRCPA